MVLDENGFTKKFVRLISSVLGPDKWGGWVHSNITEHHQHGLEICFMLSRWDYFTSNLHPKVANNLHIIRIHLSKYK